MYKRQKEPLQTPLQFLSIFMKTSKLAQNCKGVTCDTFTILTTSAQSAKNCTPQGLGYTKQRPGIYEI
jgi:hypothetical protein